MFIIAVMYFGFSYVNARPPATASLNDTAQAVEDDEPSPPRNFTRKQLSYFDGRLDEKSEEYKPVYLSVNGMQPRFVLFQHTRWLLQLTFCFIFQCTPNFCPDDAFSYIYFSNQGVFLM